MLQDCAGLYLQSSAEKFHNCINQTGLLFWGGGGRGEEEEE